MSEETLIETESPLKFRLWSNRLKRYLGQSPCIGLEKGMYADIHTLEDNQVIEQSTGLKDKNGNTVFCGDILKVKGGYLEVCWCNTLASFMLDDYEYDEDGEYQGSGNLQTIFATEVSEMEIVGNIHEGVLKR